MSIILTKNDGTTDVTYVPKAAAGARQEFVNASASVTEPETILTDHLFRTGVGNSNRHTLSVKKTLISSDGTRQGDLVASLVITIPNLDSYTTAKLNDLLKQLQCCMKNSAIADFVAGASLDGKDLHVDGAYVPA